MEVLIKDAFSGTINETDKRVKLEKYNAVFSWLGNSVNPPDMMLANSDGIEVKKLQRPTSYIQLNSSYPKNKLHADDPRIADGCKRCEMWNVRDIVYAIGIVPKNLPLKTLWLIYGDCFAASSEIYQYVHEKVQTAIEDANFEFSKTRELGRINKVDPLGVTSLRVRGLWLINYPSAIFDYIFDYIPPSQNLLELNAIMLSEKYHSFPNEDRNWIETQTSSENLTMDDIRIKSPDNPANLLDAKLIRYTI